MDKKELLKSCRYYKGEKENPNKGGTAFYIWDCERRWVNEMLIKESVSDWMSLTLNRYLDCGFASFEAMDDTPMTLKAALFSLLEHWNEGIVSTDDFKIFYNNWINGNA